MTHTRVDLALTSEMASPVHAFAATFVFCFPSSAYYFLFHLCRMRFF